MSWVRFCKVLLAACGLSAGACSTLPRNGPDDAAIVSAASMRVTTDPRLGLQYALIDISPPILALLPEDSTGTLRGFGAGRGPAPDIRVGVGDVIQVSLFESSAGGLFIPADSGTRPGNFVTLPQQTVDRRGTITVPYAGLVPAVGRSLPEIQADIESRLSNRAIEPQAVVAMVEQRANEVSVLGEVNSPKTQTIDTAGNRILDAIANAGGPRYPGYDTNVTLQRGKRKATVAFQTLIDKPEENIFVMPGDSVYVSRDQRTYLAFGASRKSGKIDFGAQYLSLAEAVGQVGGLQDDRADPREVFLYRPEHRSTLAKMGIDLTAAGNAEYIPTVYRANFRDPTSFFLAQGFPMRDKDTIYVSNADQVELFKFLALVNGVSSTVGGVADDVDAVRNVVNN
jgi:polysaccharide export outer membrane protein